MGVKDNFIYEECMKELDATFKKELDECSEKMIEISEECKTYYKNKFPGGIKFDLNSNDISPLIKKYKIDKAVILSAYSDPDFCKKNKRGRWNSSSWI